MELLQSCIKPSIHRVTIPRANGHFIFFAIIIIRSHTKLSMMTSFNGNILRVTGPLCWEFTVHRLPVNSPHKGQWHGVWVFFFIYAWTNDWVNNRDAGDLRRHRAHYDVSVMSTKPINETNVQNYLLYFALHVFQIRNYLYCIDEFGWYMPFKETWLGDADDAVAMLLPLWLHAAALWRHAVWIRIVTSHDAWMDYEYSIQNLNRPRAIHKHNSHTLETMGSVW